MNKDKLPACSDFLLQTIRTLRRPPTNDRNQSAPAGIGIDKVYEIVNFSELYSNDQYLEAISQLHQDGMILLRSSQNWTGRNAGSVDIILTNSMIPDWFRFQTRSLYTDFDGKELPDSFHQKEGESRITWLTRIGKVKHIKYSRILVYIVEDGLPAVVKNLIAKDNRSGTTPKSKVNTILANMSRD